ncbi:calmodulin-lysine N-methyltransferase [Arctopsyche grandis]|uniref:calmodulin-lysine N-methyltransferase n=1 Tax=Arctopsyche grandis TaxID=121162 RepID=UPI00406D6869
MPDHQPQPQPQPQTPPPPHKLAARKRWKILAKALLHEDRDTDIEVSVRRFTSFGILAPVFTDGDWHRYSTRNNSHSISIRQLKRSLTAKDLIGFNNTGNICVWPSEETLSIYVVNNLHIFTSKNVLELGGGMSCMAGLIVAKYGNANSVHVTDGNSKSVDNVRAIIERNRLQHRAVCSVLQWETKAPDVAMSNLYDVVLVADCLFFDEVREDLIRTIGSRLSEGGVAFVMAPQRGDTLDQFVRTSKAYGFSCAKCEKYDDVIWERHVELLKSNTCYDPSLHYPILLKLTKSKVK